MATPPPPSVSPPLTNPPLANITHPPIPPTQTHPPPASFSPPLLPAPPPASYYPYLDESSLYLGSVVSLKQLNSAVIAVLVMLVLLVLVLSFAKARTTWLQRRAATRRGAAGGTEGLPETQQDGAVRRQNAVVSVPENLISSLGRVFEYVEEAAGEGEGERECTVCLGEYKEKDALKQLHICQHIFHQVSRCFRALHNVRYPVSLTWLYVSSAVCALCMGL